MTCMTFAPTASASHRLAVWKSRVLHRAWPWIAASRALLAMTKVNAGRDDTGVRFAPSFALASD